MIHINNISKAFKEHQVIHNFSLELKEGDLIWLKGSNGCGKSTLLKMLAGIMECDSGEIKQDKEYNIGALIENPSFLEFKTLKQNLMFLFNLKNEFDYNKVKKLCEEFELDLDSKIMMKNYSLGMKQKAGIIQAIMEDQDFLLLDEPTRGMDEKSLHIFYEYIERYHKNKDKIIIIAAHDGVDEIKFNQTIHL